MSIKRKWLVVVGALVVAGVLLEILVGVGVVLAGARRGAYEWLHGQHRSSLVGLDAAVSQKLAQDAALLMSNKDVVVALDAGDPDRLTTTLDEAWRSRRGDEIWVARTSAGELLSNFPPCMREPSLLAALAPRRTHKVMCGEVAVMLSSAAPASEEPGRATLFIGIRLDETYLEWIQMVTMAHVALIGPKGLLASTLRDVDGRPARPELPPALLDAARRGESGFERASIRVSPSYGGYWLGSAPLLVGARELDAYLYAGPLAGNDRELPLTLLLFIPARILNAGAWYSSIGMGAVGLVIVLLLLMVAQRLVASFTRPLRTLVRATSKVSRGDLSIRVPVEGADEISELGTSFNEMVEQLRLSKDRAVQTEKMAAIGQLAGGVAHEINNPLGVILGFAQGMEKRVPEGDPMRLPVTSITREALRCKALVQELLTFARTARKTIEPLDLNELVQATVVLLESRGRMQGVALRLELAPELPLLDGNRTQLQQILVNLGTNALDATPEGGTIVVRTTQPSETSLCLEVSDPGPGIPMELRARVFEPFFTTKEPGKGTGLGLSLVYEIAQQHGGEIAIVDGEHGGTTMRVRLPIGTPARASGGAS